MTLVEKRLILKLANNEISREHFLAAFHATADGKRLGLRLLTDGVRCRDAEDVEYAMILGFIFGFSEMHVPLLCQLSAAGWHYQHEDVVTALGKIGDPRAIDLLLRAAITVPDYLSFDECRALSIKAIWALGRFKEPEADRALIELSRSPHPILREAALDQLRRRSGTG